MGDIILIVSWLLWEQPDPSVSIVAIIIVPALVILNLILGIVFWVFKKATTSKAFFINSAVSAIIFSLLFNGWYEYRRWRTYEIFTFEKGGNTFEVSLNKNDSGFNISDITNQSEGSTTGYMFGDYQVRADTIILTDIYSKEKCFIHRNRIYDFQGKDKSFLLRKK